MNKTLKKILALTLCVIMCLGILASCGENSSEDTPEELAQKYYSLGYKYDITYGNGDGYQDLYGLGSVYLCDINCVVEVFSSYYDENWVSSTVSEMGTFFYCNDVEDASLNAEKLSEALVYLVPSIYANSVVIMQVNKIVYIGTLEIWDAIDHSSSSPIISESTLETLLMTLLGIAITVAVLAVIVFALIHHFVILILIITAFVHSIKIRGSKKKIKQLIAAYEALAQESEKCNAPDEHNPDENTPDEEAVK